MYISTLLTPQDGMVIVSQLRSRPQDHPWVTPAFILSEPLKKTLGIDNEASLLRSRSGRSHVTLPVPTRLLQTDIHSFLGNKPINVWLSFSCDCSRLWLVQRIQWQLNERLIGPSKQKRKTPRKESMSVWTEAAAWGRGALRDSGPSGCEGDYNEAGGGETCSNSNFVEINKILHYPLCFVL